MFSSNTSQVSGGGYQISRSLRFNSADSAYLNRTPASASNQKTWTWSGWVKLGLLSINQYGMFSTRDGTTGNRLTIGLQSDNTLIVYGNNGSVDTISVFTQQVFRDPSAWYHIVIALDTTQATASNRCKVYVNGSQVTSFSTATYPTQNADLAINQASEHNIGKYALTGNFVDGYMTEINFINGQALTPSSFGETNAQTGVWQPKAYSGSYGTNGFYLNFSDNSNTTAATLGKDYSGNGNNWTPNNFSVAAGAGNDSLVDSPTAYGTDTGAGGTVRGNYCTINPLLKSSNVTIANGNLDINGVGFNWNSVYGTFLIPTTGKWYWEVIAGGSNTLPGIVVSTENLIGSVAGLATDVLTSYAYYGSNGRKFSGPGSSSSTYGATFTTGDVVGIAFDADAGTLTFYKNGTSQGQAFSGLTASYVPYFGVYDAGVQSVNFGQRPFAYTAPSGFQALCTQNLPTPTIGATTATQAGNYFAPVIYTGTGTARTVTVGFQPDFVWLKSRVSAVWYHQLYDVIRTPLKALFSNATDAETTYTDTLTAFTSNGFNLGTDATFNGPVNKNGDTYVSWNWKANGAGSTNTAGSITSTVSANTTSGFSIVTWTGNSANATIGHGLGVAPSMVIIKYRGTTDNWYVYHTSTGAGQYLVLNGSGAAAANTNIWQNTAPTSSVFSIGFTNNQSTIVAYCFAAIAGYSAFGSYTGNSSSDGPFIYCGFRPRYVLIKLSSGGLGDWMIYDAVRNTSNVMSSVLYADLANAEGTVTGIDFTSNGFKLRGTSTDFNGGYTYIYAAFAEFPQKFSLAR